MSEQGAEPISRANAREDILDAAETAFSQGGFAGAGMKAIALNAGVAQGLIHYHFQSKDGLYAAVIERRAHFITTARQTLLDEVDLARPDAVRQIFDAFFRPPFAPEGGGKLFARIFACLAAGDSRDQALVERLYDPSARRFIDALATACPNASRETCAWGYSMALGLLMGAVGRSGRPERLADMSAASKDDTEALIRRLTCHATGGFLALCAEGAA
ncbi:MAG: TetR/AcrR family transcriptional regulator [Pseudomonadota bacterium]